MPQKSPPKSTFTAKYRRLKSLLIEARQRADLTQAELAARLGRPQSFVSEYAPGQGVTLATWLRQRLQKPAEERIEPAEVLADWQVAVHQFDLGSSGVDAVACWGPRHGPAVYVNSSGRRAQEEAGRRATIAHEIAHLIVDRARALPLSEIQGGTHRGWVERRANAFAAELLMPQAVAGPSLSACSTPAEARTRVEDLARHYGASREIIAWQALNSGVPLKNPVLGELALHVPEDRRWRLFAAMQP